MPGDTRVLRWRSADGTGLEHCVIRPQDGGLLAESVVIAPAGEGHAVRYLIRFDREWRTRTVEASVAGTDRTLLLESDESGGCWRVNGQRNPALSGAIAPDLAVTPLTNTFAVERLGLREGESRDIMTAYVAFPGLEVSADPQRYTCLEKGRLYRYESLDSDFTRVIEMAADGFVLDYPSLFSRIVA